MFSKFSISDINQYFTEPVRNRYRHIARELLREYRNDISESLDSYLKENGHIDAHELSGEWFPEVKADIFISHSHADEDSALLLSGWIYDHFGLKSFIDSTVWGNISDLQRKIDEPLIMSNGNYNYSKRNQSTAYVHLLLSTALTKMMDNSEAIFFLSTPNSLNVYEKNITDSVWIYHEIFTSNFLRKQLPHRMRILQKCFSGGVLESKVSDGYKIDFSIDLNDFKHIDPVILDSWLRNWTDDDSSRSHPLDILYQMFNNQIKTKRIYG